jgi:hypothetical protein
MLLLIGHGTYDGIDAKFNSSPIRAGEWKEYRWRRRRVIVVNTTESSSCRTAVVPRPGGDHGD